MSIDRKKFLQMAVTGGFGLLFGGNWPQSWQEKGVRLKAVERQSFVMGSVISFQVVAESEKAGYEAIRKAEKVFRSLEKTFSMYDGQSEMAALAKAAGKNPLPVTDEALQLLQYAKKISIETNGRFDVTIEPAMKKWGFRNDPDELITPPADKEILKLERLIGSNKIEIENGTVMLTEPGMAIDTGGIAGGFALDKAMQIMKESDIKAGFINFSGDIHCFGKPMDTENWPVYIWNPVTNEPLPEPVELRDEALSTSGAYQNRRHSTKDHSWGHMLLPFAAEPVEPIYSVSVTHPSAIAADVWSTSIYVGAEAPEGIRKIVI